MYVGYGMECCVNDSILNWLLAILAQGSNHVPWVTPWAMNRYIYIIIYIYITYNNNDNNESYIIIMIIITIYNENSNNV